MGDMFLDLPAVPLPGPRKPLLGSRLALIRFFGDPVGTMLRAQARFGPLSGFCRDDPAWVFAFGARYNKQLLSDAGNFHNFAQSPIEDPEGSAARYFPDNLTAQNGELHRLKRRLMMPAFSKARLRGYVPTMAAIADAAIARWPTRGRLDLRREIVELTLDNSMACLFGLRGDAEARRLGELNVQFLRLIVSPATMLFPFQLPGTPYSRYLRVCEELAAALRELIARRREQGLGADVFSALIAAEEEGERFAEHELIAQAGLLVAAGYETTAMTLCWTLLLLAAHPKLQAELGEELAGTLGGQAPSAEQLESLPLLDRVIDEAMRLLPVTPMLFMRRAQTAFELEGRELPAGATLVLSPLLTHRDPELYPEPLRFTPARWEGRRPETYAYLPFGAGPRRCIGAGFAGLAVRTVLATLLQRVRVAIPPGLRVDYEVHGIIMGPKRTMELELHPADAAPAPAEAFGGKLRELVEL